MRDKTKILIVDDRPENIFAMNRVLEDLQVQIFTANSGEDALKLCLDHVFAVLIMDVQMPGMDGFETAEILRSDKDTRHMPIIFVTAINQEEKHIFRGYDTGAVDYIFKPFEPQILKSKIRTFIELFNHKLDVEQHREELKQVNESLEKKVAERTRELEIEKERAESACQLKSEFLANISHELITPLHGIMGFAGIGLKKANAKSYEKIPKYFKNIQQNSNRLWELLNDLLVLGNLQAGYTQLALMRYDLRKLIDSCVDALQLEIENKGIEIEIEEYELDKVICDVQQIHMVIDKLLKNAIAYSPDHSKIEISIRMVDQPDNTREIQVSIRDWGVGVPEEEYDHIFDPFTQSSRTKTGAGGVGLGLPICKEIVELHNGKIWNTESDKGLGSTFHFTLPFSVNPSRVAISECKVI